MSSNDERYGKKRDAEEFMYLIEKNWRTEIGYLASATIIEMNFTKKYGNSHST
jgi:hypothetical protein